MVNIKLLKNNQIDKTKWDLCVKDSVNARVYGFSWYLDCVTTNWEGLVYGDYQLVFPIIYKYIICFKKVYHPLFCQQLGPFSNSVELLNSPIVVNALLSFLYKKYSAFEFSINNYTASIFENSLILKKMNTSVLNRINLELDLSMDYKKIVSNYSNNTRRNIKNINTSILRVKEINSLVDFMSFYKSNISTKAHLTKSHYNTISSLLLLFKEKGLCHFWGVYDSNNVLLASAFFISFLKRHILLFNASNKKTQHLGAMTYLINEFIKSNCCSDAVLDFEGSNLSGVYRFYKGFGAVEKNYIYIKKSLFNIKVFN